MATFINRTKEITFLKNWLNEEPNSLLFVYGPKSSGKTTLINHLIENHLDQKKMAINYMNLRGVLIYNFKSFLDTFFTKTTKGKIREILAGVSINLGFFKVGIEDEALLKQNPFRVMEGQLMKARKKDIQPVLIIDEIQNLKNIYLNGERYLLDELFNLFVRLTKELHVAHVVLITSDSYFIQEVYHNAKLSKTTQFLHIGHLEKKAVERWLQKESFTPSDIEFVWEKLGGCAWEIAELIKQVKNGETVTEAVNNYLSEVSGKLRDYLRMLDTSEEELIQQVHQAIFQQSFAKPMDFSKALNPLTTKMVANDFWFFRSDLQQISANSESVRWAMKMAAA